MHIYSVLHVLSGTLEGDFFYNDSPQHEAQKRLYATDASSYQEKPLAVALPKTVRDIEILVELAHKQGLSLIPRAAGTSLAGQVVGSGMVVDISKYFNQILEVNTEEQWVRVQPGVIRDDLNAHLRPYGLFFGPETSTANRAMIGGMIGNNSCGLHSMVWADTRTHLLEATVMLADGSVVTFGNLSDAALNAKKNQDDFEGSLYRQLSQLLAPAATRQLIRDRFPKPSLKRRNTGYALDKLIDTQAFEPASAQPVNLCQLLAGSEGTLAVVLEAKLQLLPLPPAEVGVVCVHCHSIQEALQANLVALAHNPMASELVDKFILDFTKGHPTYDTNRFFIEGDPAAILMVEFMADTPAGVQQQAEAFQKALQEARLSYAAPLITGDKTKLVWDVRKAGLGLIRNLEGDTQPVNLIEDCAVSPEDLPAYIADLQLLLERHGLQASYYAHAGAGELHVEPMLNLKTEQGRQLFRTVLAETVQLVKKYNGSLSGEHGDGRLRGEFIPEVVGQEVYELFRKVKNIFDPKGIFNRGKIVDTPPMNESLRYAAGQNLKATFQTYFDFSKQEGILRLTEKCSGSGDCRKTHVSGGTMCPSYMATRRERDTTRARANILRQFIAEPSEEVHPLSHHEIKEVMDLCLSCKGCQAECPSQVDVAKLKAEFLQHYYDAHGISFRTKLIGNFTKSQAVAARIPWLYNALIGNELTGRLIKSFLGFHPKRPLPKVASQTLRAWYRSRQKTAGQQRAYPNGKVLLFCDEFTNYNDASIGKKCIEVLEHLGYEVLLPEHLESGRTYLSKGMVKEAKRIANQNIQELSRTPGLPILGIEPSAILTLRDEYLSLATPENQEAAQQLAARAFLVDEFMAAEVKAGRITSERFTDKPLTIKLHGHCHQKALSNIAYTQQLLSLPKNYRVTIIPSGCCGMAGSFGYEDEHYEVSMQIGELVLFPAVRKAPAEVAIAAVGTSCRHQIKDGTGREAQHPLELLWEAMAVEG